MIINITFDSSVANAPAGFKAAVAAAVKFYQTTFDTTLTVNIREYHSAESCYVKLKVYIVTY